MRTNNEKRSGVYIHVPFCVRKCRYCAFLSAPAEQSEIDEYVRLAAEEMKIRAGEVRGADTVFFGGGTPSLLTPEQIRFLIETARSAFEVTDDAEITMEANPATVTPDSLSGYREAGVNRLSMGVQSMDDALLKRLGRIHSAADVRRDFADARKAGFENINLDIIFAIPGESEERSLRDLEEIAALEPDHISFYSLQLEEGTEFFRLFEDGLLEEVPDDVDRRMYHAGIDFLGSRGYEHYEISNFARPGKMSRHNMKYWSMAEYAGIGLGASSYTRGADGAHRRSRDHSAVSDYREALMDGRAPFADVHVNSDFDDISEAVFTGLRRSGGIRFDEAAGSKERFMEIYRDAMAEAEGFVESGHLVITGDGMKLTEKGIDISNRIMALFV
jgi:oxygen-independent coproporphyrinogen-3 oxidase